MIPKHRLFSLVLLALPLFSLSQENSPYSRYGIGNLVPQGNLINRSMGGIAAGFADVSSINFVNPASYAHFATTPDISKFLPPTIFDIGAEVSSRTLKSTTPVGKFTSNNLSTSYLLMAFPLTSKRMAKNNMSWGLNLGLVPLSKIDYKIQKDGRNAIDTLTTFYEGTGGLNNAFIGTGFRVKDFNIGFNMGYIFGKKDYSTRLIFLNDTVNYLKSNSANKTSIGGLSFKAGVQYTISLKKRVNRDSFPGTLRIGAYGNLQQKFNGSQDIIRETFIYSTSGGAQRLDSVYDANQKGTVQLPASFGVGFTIERQHWLYGIDFEMTNWDSYTFYGQKDLVKNNWTARAGFQYYPAGINSRKFAQFIKYRAGVSIGPDYIIANKKLPQFNVSVGAGLPLKLKRAFYETQYSILNVHFEYGNRGNTANNIRENILRIGVGFSLSDVWFRRYKYQ